ncbi:hypothetical protein NL529_31920, partial [Klebsiella pneumoniae]|nr:hypothetical protein [Klebsiella pneumoniae]
EDASEPNAVAEMTNLITTYVSPVVYKDMIGAGVHGMMPVEYDSLLAPYRNLLGGFGVDHRIDGAKGPGPLPSDNPNASLLEHT